MLAHKWQPLEGLKLQSSNVDFREIDSLHRQWMRIRRQREQFNPEAYRDFLQRVHRSWAIETGIIEGLYHIDRGTTQTLVEHGFILELIDRTATDCDPQDLVKMLRDHQESAEFVTESIRQNTSLSSLYIRELHQLLTRNQNFYTAINQFGQSVKAPLEHGDFKKQTNNPTRPDGSIHEYCPPIQVESEIDSLVALYNEYEVMGGTYHALSIAAWLHHRFTQIHPFQDGNGRVARALLSWHLAKHEYLPIVISRGDRKQYIEALELADSGDLVTFVRFIVQLERRMILGALDEPEPVTDSGMISQVLDHIAERVRRRENRLGQMLSVNDVASSLQRKAITYLTSKAEPIRAELVSAGLAVETAVDYGGPGNNEHWYRAQVVRTAQDANHWANLNERRFFIKLAINPERQSRTPRLIFVISLHHVGRQLSGVMAATAFAQIGNAQDQIVKGSEEPSGPDFKNCTVEPFTFTWSDDVDAVAAQFSNWIEVPLSIALRHWSQFIS